MVMFQTNGGLQAARLFLTCICLAEMLILVPNLLTEIAIQRGTSENTPSFQAFAWFPMKKIWINDKFNH